ncbi:hypothetical protein FS749_013792 [Ceratobasidium sp. UAMH 11750]|nr:hypothetical protein FS749_013792 [Ceratobasidium sp. UAMH 11750]
MVSVRNFIYLTLSAAPYFVHGRFISTFPSATTVINGDTEVILKWMYTPENNTVDPFESTRALCDLMWGDQAYRVALLAQNVDPFDNELKVFIRSDYGFNSSQYYIRYRSNDQKGFAYSDRFTLANMDGPDFSLNTTSHGAGGAVASQARFSTSSWRPNSTPIFTPAGRPTSIRGTPTLSINGAPGNYPQGDEPMDPSTPTETATPDIQSNGSSALSLTRQRDSAWKKISLLLWPLMVGAVMAM